MVHLAPFSITSIAHIWLVLDQVLEAQVAATQAALEQMELTTVTILEVA